MYKIGDLTFYKSHGICRIDHIIEQNFSGKPMLYYVMQSKIRPGVVLYHPVESKNSQLEKILSHQEALHIMECFSNEPSEWNDRTTNRHRNHADILSTNNHLKSAQLMNTLLRKELELQKEDKKISSQDSQTLQQISAIILDVLEIALKQPKEDIEKEILLKIHRTPS
ncbi:CarD family transcriptional regulator [Solibacillus silvestris]|uniref:CarD family transcriptional regulator n=1 Tax=Solibacillus silvestris TaxID=76853 RepID=UPI003F7F4253